MDVFPEASKKRITGKEDLILSLDNSGLYLVKIAARASGKENLQIEIDGRKFSDSPAVFAGSKLKGFKETILFILPLNSGRHIVSLVPDLGVDLEEFKVAAITDNQININDQAEDGDRRPWIVFVLADLPLVSVNPTITYSRRKRDSDDVKIIIDGKTQWNVFKTIKYLFWRFAGSLLSKGTAKTETETFTPNLPQGLHFIEFWADRMPVLKDVSLNIGEIPLIIKRIPTVDDPKWTGNFDDDTEEMLLARLILGEVEGQPRDAKIGVGFSVLNRLRKKNPNWGYSIKEIILKENQYDGMWNKDTYQKTRNPLGDTSETRKQQWQESYEVAAGILAGIISDTTAGATNFHSYQHQEDFPRWATKEAYKTKLGNIYFYELES